MFRIGTLLLVAVAIGAASTNPGEEDHKKVVCDKMSAGAGMEGLMGKVAGSLIGDLDLVPIKYHNYGVFSTTTVRDKTTSVGFLRIVRATDWDNLGEKGP